MADRSLTQVLKERIGIRIFLRRKELRLTGLQLATAAGVTHNTIYHLESGKFCSIDTLWKVSQVLKLSIDALFQETHGAQRLQGDSAKRSDDVFCVPSGLGCQRFGPASVRPGQPLFKLRNGTAGS